MFSIAVTVVDSASGGAREDLVVRAGGTQTVGELAAQVARRLGRRTPGTLRVRRTGQTLAAGTLLGDADLLDGDVLIVLD